jgi:two-component system chemotaxis response regulator CheY
MADNRRTKHLIFFTKQMNHHKFFNEDKPSESVQTNDSASSDLLKKRILSVEDDADSRELLEFVLADYELVFAGSVSEATRLFESENFHLCLLDNRLSDGAGIDLCSKIRAFNQIVPIVFASGVAHKKDIQKALDAGAQSYLVKPYFPEELQKIVKELIEQTV